MNIHIIEHCLLKIAEYNMLESEKRSSSQPLAYSGGAYDSAQAGLQLSNTHACIWRDAAV